MALNYVTLTGNLPRAAFATAIFTPSNWLVDATDAQLIPPASRTITLSSQGTFSVSLLATDNSNATPNGWYWTITICGIVGVPSYTANFFLLRANGATQDISGLATVSSPAPVTVYMPVPSGAPVSGQVPIATGTGQGSAWGNVLADPMTTLGDLIQGGTGGSAQRLAGNTGNTRQFLRSVGSGGVATAPAWDTLQAADIPTLNQNTTGTASNVTGTVTIGNGGTGQITQQAAINALTGTQSSGKYLRSDGTNAGLASIQAGDVPTLNQNTTGTAANVTATLDQIPAPAASVSLNSKKITSLANGTAATDGAAFGQIPTADNTAAHILADGAQAAGANGQWADSGHVHPPVNGSWLPGSGSSGFLGWNSDPATGSGGGVAVAGTVYLQRLNFYQSTTITNLWYWITALGTNNTGSTGSFVGLISSSGTLLTGSADMASKFGSAGTAGATSCAVTTPQSFTAGQFCWAVLLTNLTGTGVTQPTLLRQQNTAINVNGGLTAANFRWATNGTSQTSLNSITPSSNVSTAFSFVVAWS